MLSSDLRSLYESYQNIYEEGDGISCEMIEEIVEELFEECLEFGHTIDESASVVEEAAIQYLMELNPYAPAGSKEAKAYQKSTTATKRGEARKTAVKTAVGKAKAKAKGAVAAASIGASIAKDEARRAGRAAAHAVSSTVQKKKAEVKSGVKSLIGKGLRKAAGAVGKVAQKAAGAASRLGENVEQLDEISADLGLRASKAADKKRAELARAGNREGAAAKAAQAKRLYDKQAAKRLNREEVDLFDLVLEFLQVEGYENPEQLMAELSFEHIEAILEAQEARNNPEKYEREQDKKYAPVRGEKTPMPPRGNKRREDFEKWYAANVR